jgi:hypothetical protein
VVLADTLAADPVPLHVRQQRVRNGSKRQRDLVAIRMAEELRAFGSMDRDSYCTALTGWVSTRKALRHSLGIWSSAYRNYIRPLRPVGTDGEALVLSAAGGCNGFTSRRYSGLIAEALRTQTDFQGVRFVSGGEG